MRYPFTKSMLAELKINSFQRMEGTRLTELLIINDKGEIIKNVEYDDKGERETEVTYTYDNVTGRIEKESHIKSKIQSDIIYRYNDQGILIKKITKVAGKPERETKINFYSDGTIASEITGDLFVDSVKYHYNQKVLI